MADTIVIETPVATVLEVSGLQGPQGPKGDKGDSGEASGSLPWTSITGKPSTFTPSTHTHTSADVTDFSSAVVAAAPPTTNASLLTSGTLADARLSAAVTTSLGKADSASQPGHTHTASAISDSTTTGRSVLTATDAAAARTAIGAQASGSYAAATHTHAIADVTGLQTALDGKQASGSYAAASHTHTASEISDSTTAGRALLTGTDAAAQRASLGLGTLATQSGTSSGTNTGDQTITLTGDVTGSGTGSFAATIANNAITNAKLAQVSTSTLKGRLTAATGNLEDLTATQVRTLLNVADGATANSADAILLARANHTGTQAASTITGLAASATTDTTNASNISSGTLAIGRVPTGTTSTTVALGNHTHELTALAATGATNGHLLTANGSGGVTFAAAPAGGTKTYAVFTAGDNQPTASSFATLDTRNSIAVLDFDDTATESGVFVGTVPEAASLGSGLIVRLHFMATTATSGNVRWSVAFERSNTDLDADSFDTATAATVATNGTSGIVTVGSITCTSIDSVTAGDLFRLRVQRLGADAADSMTGDAELVAVEIRSAA